MELNCIIVTGGLVKLSCIFDTVLKLKGLYIMFRILLLILLLAPAIVRAVEAVPVEPRFKLTMGHFVYSGGVGSNDINLRNSSASGNLWLGYYESRQRAEAQFRGGWDHTFNVSGFRISPSIQVASMGFFSLSAQAEVGESWFVGAGLGRTNLRPYSNLNFDPNDSWMVSAGKRTATGEVFYLQQVRDNRLSPDQRHVHAYYRMPFNNGDRVTLDMLYKTGLVGDTLIHKWGVSLVYDWSEFFVSVAYDPKVNFSTDNMLRSSIGIRF